MQFVRKQERRRKIRLEQGKDADSYPHILQFYRIPPTENISLQEFEDFAVERVKVLKAVENTGVKYIKVHQEWKDHLLKEFQNLKKNNVLKGITDVNRSKKLEEIDDEEYEERRKDHISHFILRLAYCRSEDLRRWFINQEMDLFRYRFLQESENSIKQFLKLNNFDYTPIPNEDKNNILKELITSAGDKKSVQVDTENYYKVPFTDALDLVRGRRVYLSKGYAYVPQSELVVIILTHFRVNLSHALAVTARTLPNLEEDGRLLPMLNNMSKQYLGQDYSSKKPTMGAVTADMVDGLSKKHFPPCMQQLQQGIRTDHHLRYGGRQQYGLFLKGIGLSLEEAMTFWRMEFTKIMDVDKFDKQYSYNVRHAYGKEGKRADYTPYSCVKIITSNTPSTGDYHGCPFRHGDIDLLKQKLQNLGWSKTDVTEVGDLAKRGHCQLACARYFEVANACERDTVSINHPNEYFDLSSKSASATVKTEGTSITPKIVKIEPRTPKNKSSNEDSEFDIPLSAEEFEKAMEGVESSVE